MTKIASKLRAIGSMAYANKIVSIVKGEVEIKLLWQGDYMKVALIDGWYTACVQGNGVCVLLYDISDPDNKKFILREETNPAHGGVVKTSLTGMIDEGEQPIETAVREVKEESGITITEKDIIRLGWVHPDKGGTKKVFLFAADASEKEIGEIKGDGTKGEDGAVVTWANMEFMPYVNEPLMLAIAAKLKLQGIDLF